MSPEPDCCSAPGAIAANDVPFFAAYPWYAAEGVLAQR